MGRFKKAWSRKAWLQQQKVSANVAGLFLPPDTATPPAWDFELKVRALDTVQPRVEPRFEQLGSGKRKGKKNSRNRVSGEVGCCCVCFVFSCFIIVFYLFSSLVVSSCLF